MNYMKQIAKMLNVEIGEEFKIEGHDDNLKFQFTENRFLQSYGDVYGWVDSISIMTVLEGRAKIIKLPKPVLTDEEKEYLSNVVKPWRNKVKTITKYWGTGDCVNEFIQICYIQNGFDYYMSLPQFERGLMYRGIELEKAYTLDDLGL